jgi:hypothetical protein
LNTLRCGKKPTQPVGASDADHRHLGVLISDTQFAHFAHKSNAEKPDYLCRWTSPTKDPSKPDIPPDDRWRIPMKSLILAAFAALSLTTAIVPAAYAASTVAGDAQATRQQQTGAYSD